MEATSVSLYSKTNPFGFALVNNNRLSLRHFSKHLQGNLTINNNHHHQRRLKLIKASSDRSFHLKTQVLSSVRRKNHFLQHPIKCSYSNTTTNPDSENPLLKHLKNLSFDSLRANLSQFTPIDVCKWCGMLAIVIAATKWTTNLVVNPFTWMYFSWTWMFWPWIVAIGLAVYGLYCFRKHSCNEANVFEQLAIVTSAFTWLTLVPPAHFNGYLEGWPFVFFFVYHYFFFFNVTVRKRQYGDYYARPHDPKWDVSLPNWRRLLFCVGVMAGHWLAAFEGPELHLTPGGWSNVGIWILVFATLFMQYYSTVYLAKYTEKVVVPTAVVQFGPYRWVRHPIYASTMLLFVTYCVALRAPLTSLFAIAVCLLYYEQKAKLEEALMLETFGESYKEYMGKVRYKFIPFVH